VRYDVQFGARYWYFVWDLGYGPFPVSRLPLWPGRKLTLCRDGKVYAVAGYTQPAQRRQG